mmetsp:Transcript_1391/g.3043  ORF Transcript_1391/g.3043 Transcript_1391/m.3043 type:complete len:221 (-) Transcript_1391:184-846(-)
MSTSGARAPFAPVPTVVAASDTPNASQTRRCLDPRASFRRGRPSPVDTREISAGIEPCNIANSSTPPTGRHRRSYTISSIDTVVIGLAFCALSSLLSVSSKYTLCPPLPHMNASASSPVVAAEWTKTNSHRPEGLHLRVTSAALKKDLVTSGFVPGEDKSLNTCTAPGHDLPSGWNMATRLCSAFSCGDTSICDAFSVAIRRRRFPLSGCCKLLPSRTCT